MAHNYLTFPGPILLFICKATNRIALDTGDWLCKWFEGNVKRSLQKIHHWYANISFNPNSENFQMVQALLVDHRMSFTSLTQPFVTSRNRISFNVENFRSRCLSRSRAETTITYFPRATKRNALLCQITPIKPPNYFSKGNCIIFYCTEEV